MGRSQLQIWNRYPEEEIVVKANELVMSKLNWTTREYRVFVAHVSQISREAEGLEEVSVRLQDLCELSDIETENLYGEIEDIADRLTGKKIRVEKGQRGERVGGFFNVYSSCKYREQTGEIIGRFTQEIRPFLYDLSERFTMYYRRHALSMRSTYSMRFYEILKRYEHRGEFKLEVSELRKIFGLEEKYDRFVDLRRRVIDKAQSELDERSDVTFEYFVEREGRTPVVLHFDIEKTGSEPEPVEPVDDRLPDAEPTDAEKKLESLPEEDQKHIRERAREKAREANPDLSGYSLKAQTWRFITRILREEYP